jgi:hypothetical protein
MVHVKNVQAAVAWERLQRLPQLPQLLLSFVKLTHWVPASRAPAHVAGSVAGHTQALLTQEAPLGHCMPQFPQLLMSVVVSTQMPEHILSVLWHGTQVLFEHRCPVGQAFPQPPQLPWSLATSTHTPLHAVDCAAGHLQAPAVHIAPRGHAVAHDPQCNGSVCVSTHCPGSHRVVGHSWSAGKPSESASPASPLCASRVASRARPSVWTSLAPSVRTSGEVESSTDVSCWKVAASSPGSPTWRSLNPHILAQAAADTTSAAPSQANRGAITTSRAVPTRPLRFLRPDPRTHRPSWAP